MSYTRPTLAAFKTQFPAFTTLQQAQYDLWIAKAEARVGDNYGADQQDATELLTAHLLTINSVGLPAGAATLAATGATSFRSGAFQATVSDSVVSARARGGYQATTYGQQFAEIQRSRFGGPRLVGCA